MGVKVDWSKYFKEWSNDEEFKKFLNTNYMYSVLKYLSQEYNKFVIYPLKKDIFKPFQMFSPKDIKVVILGEEPMFNGRSNGLAYGCVKESLKISPTLQKIQRAVELDVGNGLQLDFDYTLEKWAKQGVLLLNTSLTVRHGEVGSHKKVWAKFNNFVIQFIAEKYPGTIFLFWSKQLKQYRFVNGIDIQNTCYCLSESSPMFHSNILNVWDCKHFGIVNKLIEDQNGKEFCIKW